MIATDFAARGLARNLSAEIAHADTSANAVGAADLVSPAGRQIFAPALVTSMQARRMNGVSLRDLVGRNYNPSNDASQCFNGFITELAPAGITVNDPDNLEILCEAPLRPASGMKLSFGCNTTIKRGFSSGSSSFHCLMANSDWSVDVDDFLIEGGIWRSASPSQEGRIFSFYGNNWEIRNAQILEFYGAQALVFGGDNVRLHNIRAVTSATGYGTGAFRMVGGRGFRGTNLQGVCGDDVFQFVPSTNSIDARRNQSIEDSVEIGCQGASASARLLVAGVAGPQNELAMTCTIRRVGWIGCTGSGGQRSLVIENTEGNGTVPRQIDQVLVSGCHLDGSNEFGPSSQTALILSSFPNAIGTVTLRDTSFHGSPKAEGLSIQSDGARILLDNVSIVANVTALSVSGQAKVTIRDGYYALNSVSSGSPNHIIDIRSTSQASATRVEGTPLIEGVASGKAAIRISSPTANLHVESLEAHAAPGATGTIGVSHSLGVTAFIGSIGGTVATYEAGAGSILRQALVGRGPYLEISGGGITLNATENLLETEGLAANDDLDTVTFPSWAANGQIFVIRAHNGARTITIKDGIGNIRCAGDRVLDNLDDMFTGVKVGSDLVEIGFADNGA